MSAAHGRHRVSESVKRCQGNAVRLAFAGLAALAVLLGVALPAQAGTSHQGRAARSAYLADVGAQWGSYADAQIKLALANDPGNNRPYANASLAYGVAHRSPLGWDDPAARHYLELTLSQPNPYGLNYSWDAFQDGTTNPASTIYTITLAQVGEVVLDAYRHGAATYTQVTDIERLVVNQPRIAVSPGIALAYSNDRNDVKAGYAVHNINQAIALFLHEIQDAGILWSDSQVKSWISKLSAYEKATYQPKIVGWAYRNGGSQALQDPGHNAVGALWGMWWDPSSIGYPVLNRQMATNYGYQAGGAMHATLAAWSCSASTRWYPEVDQLTANVDTYDLAARLSRPLSYSSGQCAPTAKMAKARTHFTIQPTRPSLRSTTPHLAPDAL